MNKRIAAWEVCVPKLLPCRRSVVVKGSGAGRRGWLSSFAASGGHASAPHSLVRRYDAMKGKFTRSDIWKILEEHGLGAGKARKATTRIFDALAESLAAGETIELRGFGSWETRERKAHKARNPRTGEPVMINDRRRILFRPGQELKLRLRQEANQ